MKERGKVLLIGAGPGDPELMTLKAVRLLGTADVVVFDRLVSPEILAMAPRTAAMLPVGKEPGRHPVPQDEINRLLIRLAEGGLTVARLKGGDPLIFGRGGEEALELSKAGIDIEVVPGITAAQGCAAKALVPLTHRGVATSLRFVTGHCRDGEPLDLDWSGLADPRTTVVVYMGYLHIAEIAGKLIAHGRAPSTPVLAIADGTLPGQRNLRCELASVAEDIVAAGMANPVTFFVGEAAGIELGRSGATPRLRLVEPPAEAIRA